MFHLIQKCFSSNFLHQKHLYQFYCCISKLPHAVVVSRFKLKKNNIIKKTYKNSTLVLQVHDPCHSPLFIPLLPLIAPISPGYETSAKHTPYSAYRVSSAQLCNPRRQPFSRHISIGKLLENPVLRLGKPNLNQKTSTDGAQKPKPQKDIRFSRLYGVSQ